MLRPTVTWREMCMVVVLATCLAAARSEAQAATPRAIRDQFRAFMAPMLGIVTVEVVDRDAAGQVEYRATQTREFSVTAGGHYVREVLLNEVDPRREGGVLLHGVAGSSIHTFNFWGAEADGLFVTWTFDGPRRLIGTGTEQVNGVGVPMRAEMSWDADTLTWRTWVRPAGSPEYLDHTLTYRRQPAR